jgi:catechol 2,3-dioxygenase
LGTGGEDFLHLVQEPKAQRAQGTTGLYHFALLLPNRKEMARAVAKLLHLRYPNYPTDHVVSKSTYLDDAEGNNIELYIYSAEDGEMVSENGRLTVRRSDGRPSSGRDPLDLEALFSELSPQDDLEQPLPPETIMGHVHLYGSSLLDSMHFYHEVLGFKKGLLARDFRMGDVGLDRPHVIAFNDWKGQGAPPQPPGALGLRHYTIIQPDQSEVQKLSERLQKAGADIKPIEHGLMAYDPSRIALRIISSGDETRGSL